MINVYKSLEFDEIISQIKARCAFSLGVEVIETIEPSNNSLLVKQRLSLTNEVLQLINIASEYDLGGVSDVSSQLERADKDMIITGLELLKISDLNKGVKSILSKVKSSELDLVQLNELIVSLTTLDALDKSITNSINSYGEVLDSASSKLSSLRRDSNNLNKNFEALVSRFISHNKTILVDSIESERNGRKVVLLNSNFKNSLKGVIHGESKSGQSIYFEPEAFITFNNDKQSIVHLILEEEEKILFELSQLVKAESMIIHNNLNILAQLDGVLAISKWGFEKEAIIADISLDHSIFLENVAHPLIDPKQVVRNTYNIKDGSTLIVSGPNTGGKTVTLKTIGLSILMSMCGIPIVADYASVPIVDNIFIDLGDEQSVVSALSTFSSHLTTLSYIVNNVTKDSLVLLDELGSGTDPKEGEALAIATLEYLRSKSAITLVTTHLSGLKTYAQNDEDILLASVEFDDKTLSPTYRFIEGLAGQSNALQIANKFNFPSVIMTRANEIKNTMLTDEEKLMQTLEEKEYELVLKFDEFEKSRQALEQQQLEFNEKLEAEKVQGSKIIEKAKQDALKYVAEKQEEADQLYESMLEHHRKTKLSEASEIRQQFEKSKEKLQVKKVSNHKFEVNDSVRVEGLHHIGTIVDIDKSNVSVNVNGMTVRTKLSKLEYVEVKDRPKQRTRVNYQSSTKVERELNLIGLTVHESLAKVDKFIDNAILSNLNSVTIIHGVGSGKLRAGVIDHLKRNKSVKSFSNAPQSSGGLGATVVNIK